LLQAVDCVAATSGGLVAIESNLGPGGASYEAVAFSGLLLDPNFGNDGMFVLEQPHSTSAARALAAIMTRINTSL
jgi:hypothetical protein